MTQKRFNRVGGYVYDNDTCISHFEDVSHRDDIVTLLNELHEENQRLKQHTKQVLQNHLDGWRGVYNPIDESIVVEINVVKSIAEDLGVDLE